MGNPQATPPPRTIIAAFAGGTFLATIAYSVIPRLSMLPPVLLLLWIIYQDLVRPIAELSPVRDIGGLSIEDLGGGVLAYHVLPSSKPASGATKGASRPVLPDLLRWADHLPESTRVLLLDLTKFPYLCTSGADEIRALASRLNALEVQLVLGGLDHHAYEVLRQRGALALVGNDKVFGDTELALARAVSISNTASFVR